jgi:hypothetical protein
MKKFIILLIFFSKFALADNSLCEVNEKILFSCQIGKTGKIVSLCSSPNLKKETAYLQYRYGSKGKIELTFPSEKANSLEKFRYAHYFRYQVDRTQVSFSNAEYEYSIFAIYEDDGKWPIEEQGILISKEGQSSKETRLLCRSTAIAHLEKLENVLPCDVENALASCDK